MNDEDMKLYRLDPGVATAVTKKGEELTKLRNEFNSSMSNELGSNSAIPRAGIDLSSIDLAAPDPLSPPHASGAGAGAGQKTRKYSPIERKCGSAVGGTPPRGTTMPDRAFSPSLEVHFFCGAVCVY
jgi:hypothetical protein